MGYTASFSTGSTGLQTIHEIDGYMFDTTNMQVGEIGTKFELPEMKFFKSVQLNELISVTKSWAESWNLLATKVMEEGVELTETVELMRESSSGTKGWKCIEVGGVKYAIKNGKYLVL
tara:strand:+ start:3959 stop:4312 length:354 start_codon:yes stop_codon:yes gene_type:complete